MHQQTEEADYAEVRLESGDRIDFRDPHAARQLTVSLLKRNFNLDVDLPPDRLCPPTSRYLYVRWIQDLVGSINPAYFDSFDITAASETPIPCGERQVTGLDIGCGASCIYTLLALRTRPRWRMSATEIDSLNFSYALRNVQANGFSARCHVMKMQPCDPLIPLSAFEQGELDFTICNPPFFSSVEEWKASVAGEGKAASPSSVCTGAEVEMVTEGGDLGFALRMLHESTALGERVAWYTSMLGKLSSTIKLVETLRGLGCRNWAVCCLGANHKTRRWVVGWSWRDLRPRAEIARRQMNIKHILPLPTDYELPISDVSVEQCIGSILETMRKLDIEWKWNENLRLGYGRAAENVWSRSARRKTNRQGSTPATVQSKTDVALGFEIRVQAGKVLLRWVQGQDHVLFESFCGVMKQALRPSPVKLDEQCDVNGHAL